MSLFVPNPQDWNLSDCTLQKSTKKKFLNKFKKHFLEYSKKFSSNIQGNFLEFYIMIWKDFEDICNSESLSYQNRGERDNIISEVAGQILSWWLHKTSTNSYCRSKCFSAYRWSTVLSLKGQFNELFELQFFSQIEQPALLTNKLKQISILVKNLQSYSNYSHYTPKNRITDTPASQSSPGWIW